MRTLWNKTHLIESLIFKGKDLDSNIFSSIIALIPDLDQDLKLQKKVYYLLKMYRRKRIKKEVEEIGHWLLTDPSSTFFQQKIFQIFK